MIEKHRITIIRKRKPIFSDVNSELQWFADSLGITSLRDRDKSCYRLFVEFVKNPKREMSSDELAYKLNLSRGTIIHHLNRLMESGVVTPEKNRYLLRVTSLKSLISEIEEDVQKSIEDIKKIAENLDKEIGLGR